MLHHCFTQQTKWTKKTNGLADMWASRSKPKQGIRFTSNGRHSSLVSRLLPPALPGPPTPASGVQRRCFARLVARRYPADGQVIPPLRTSCYSLPSVGPPHTRTIQVSHSSSSATPLPRLPHLRVVPVWGLAVVHRLAVLGTTWSTYESHRKRTVRGEPDGWDP